MDFSTILKDWQQEFYTEVLLLIVEIFTLIIFSRYAEKSKVATLFIIYITFDLSLFMVDQFLFTNTTGSLNSRRVYSASINVLVAQVELIIYYYYFSKILAFKRIKYFLLAFAILYSAFAMTYTFTLFRFLSNRYDYYSFLLGGLEFILLLPPCILYYIQLFNNVTELPLTKRPSFWIVTGIFFYALISIPFFFLTLYISHLKNGYASILIAIFFNIPFAINFIFLSKAVLCKKTLTI